MDKNNAWISTLTVWQLSIFNSVTLIALCDSANLMKSSFMEFCLGRDFSARSLGVYKNSFQLLKSPNHSDKLCLLNTKVNLICESDCVEKGWDEIPGNTMIP